MASAINRALEVDQLTAVGKLEQDVVFGEVTSKHILEFFTAYPDLSPEAKARTPPSDCTPACTTCLLGAASCGRPGGARQLHTWVAAAAYLTRPSMAKSLEQNWSLLADFAQDSMSLEFSLLMHRPPLPSWYVPKSILGWLCTT